MSDLTAAEMEFVAILVTTERERLYLEPPTEDEHDTEIRAQCIERCDSILAKLGPSSVWQRLTEGEDK